MNQSYMYELFKGQLLGRLKKESDFSILFVGEDKVEKGFSYRRNSCNAVKG